MHFHFSEATEFCFFAWSRTRCICSLLTLTTISSPTTVSSKISNKGKDKNMGDSKTEKQKAIWTMFNKRLFIDLALGQRCLENRSGKAFTAIGRDNILKAFKNIVCLQYELLQFKNLYGQISFNWKAWNSFIRT